ncbi:MAG TPA: metallophosphoesterase [Syntrophomonadaceae bacterium]|nr:metallophosphoesterase [Syntrophomonadaceae bacterium]
MNPILLSFISIFAIIYGLSNYYIALRGWQALASHSRPWAWVWIAAVTILASLFILARLVARVLPDGISKVMTYAGSYWMAAWYYLLLLLLLIDLLRLLAWIGPLPPLPWVQWRYPIFLLVSGMVSCLLIYGTWNAWHPVVRDYNLEMPKKTSNLDELNLVMVSDIHLGWIVGVDRLTTMVTMVNQLHPDLILLVGDILDEGVDPQAEQEIPGILGQLSSRFGSYAVLGNHEYISGQADKLPAFLQAGGVTLLRDQSLQVGQSFYLVGRDDRSRGSMEDGKRKDLSELVTAIDLSALPVILMDHQPFNLEEAESNRVDLQLSGHTHLGQIAPNQLITRAIYEDDWGYLRKGTLQLLVSCGFGTWGPPIRIGNHPEIVHVHIRFFSPT